jgi:predicted RNA-binding Zn-ribbon protein involved in translation (DUF1610 family)
MREQPKYFSEEKPVRCPHCGSEAVVEILYGFPRLSAIMKASEGTAVLGGCEVDPSNPSWQCTQCGTVVYREGLRSRFADDNTAF